jgi:hypothetical protein
MAHFPNTFLSPAAENGRGLPFGSNAAPSAGTTVHSGPAAAAKPIFSPDNSSTAGTDGRSCSLRFLQFLRLSMNLRIQIINLPEFFQQHIGIRKLSGVRSINHFTHFSQAGGDLRPQLQQPEVDLSLRQHDRGPSFNRVRHIGRRIRHTGSGLPHIIQQALKSVIHPQALLSDDQYL